MTVSDDDLRELIDAEILSRRVKVMFYKNAGWTWQDIATEVGVSVRTCRNDLAVVIRDLNNEQPSDVIARHRAVIFDIQRANYPKMMTGDKDAAMVILKALDREARLLGLDQPVRLLAAVSGEEFATEASRLIRRIQELDPAGMKELQRAGQPDAQIIDAETVGDPRDLLAADGATPSAGPDRRVHASPPAEGDPDPADPDSGPAAVLGPWRVGQPVDDPAASALADAAWGGPVLPGQPGDPERGPADRGPVVPDEDDDWSNLGD